MFVQMQEKMGVDSLGVFLKSCKKKKGEVLGEKGL